MFFCKAMWISKSHQSLSKPRLNALYKSLEKSSFIALTGDKGFKPCDLGIHAPVPLFLSRHEGTHALTCLWGILPLDEKCSCEFPVGQSKAKEQARDSGDWVWVPPLAWSDEGLPFVLVESHCRVPPALQCIELCALNAFYFFLWWNTYNILSF